MSVVNCCLIFVEGSTDKAVFCVLGPKLLVTAHGHILCQVVASLSVSLLLLGYKFNGVRRLVQVNQRRTELKAALALLPVHPKMEEERLVCIPRRRSSRHHATCGGFPF